MYRIAMTSVTMPLGRNFPSSVHLKLLRRALFMREPYRTGFAQQLFDDGIYAQSGAHKRREDPWLTKQLSGNQLDTSTCHRFTVLTRSWYSKADSFNVPWFVRASPHSWSSQNWEQPSSRWTFGQSAQRMEEHITMAVLQLWFNPLPTIGVQSVKG